jgi:Pyruvate/2-oxoacid:ferredoxin oxidoreductase gamma subunit
MGVKLAGAGGDGAQTAAALIARAAIEEGLDATHIPSYGPESRGGTSFADVRLAAGEVLSPEVPAPDALVAFNAPSLARFGPAVVEGGLVLYDSSVVPAPELGGRIRQVGVPCSRIAAELGQPLVKNVVALGALQAATRLLEEATLLATLREALARNAALAEVNLEAFRRGASCVSDRGAPATAG